MNMTFTGGRLDGWQWQPPYPPPPGVVTTSGCYYVLDGQGVNYAYTGTGAEGKTMGRIAQAFNAAAMEAAIAAAAPQGCGRCGRTFENQAACTIGHEDGRCLSDTAHGQLVLVDGVWCEAWRYPQHARR